MIGDEDLARLNASLLAGARLLIVRADTVADRRRVLEWIEENPRGYMRVHTGVADPVTALVGTRGVGVILGDDGVFGADRDKWFQSLNTGRDLLLARADATVLLADDVLLTELPRRAPDFWGGRSGLVIGGDPGVREGLEDDLGEIPPLTLGGAWKALGSRSSRYFVDPGGAGWGAAYRRILGLWRVRDEGFYVLHGARGVGIRTLMDRLRESPGSVTPTEVEQLVGAPGVAGGALVVLSGAYGASLAQGVARHWRGRHVVCHLESTPPPPFLGRVEVIEVRPFAFGVAEQAALITTILDRRLGSITQAARRIILEAGQGNPGATLRIARLAVEEAAVEEKEQVDEAHVRAAISAWVRE